MSSSIPVTTLEQIKYQIILKAWKKNPLKSQSLRPGTCIEIKTYLEHMSNTQETVLGKKTKHLVEAINCSILLFYNNYIYKCILTPLTFSTIVIL